MVRLNKRTENLACTDEQDPNALPIVSAREGAAGKTTLFTAILIDGERAIWDEAAIHGRTPLEQDVEWVQNPDEVPNGRRIHVIWVYVRPKRPDGYQYSGMASCDMLIDSEALIGYKKLATHVNQMSKAMRRTFDLSSLDEATKTRLIEALETNEGVLENSPPELHEALGLTVQDK